MLVTWSHCRERPCLGGAHPPCILDPLGPCTGHLSLCHFLQIRIVIQLVLEVLLQVQYISSMYKVCMYIIYNIYK